MGKYGYPYPDAPCMVSLPTFAPKIVHFGANVGKYTIHGAYGIPPKPLPPLSFEAWQLGEGQLVGRLEVGGRLIDG